MQLEDAGSGGFNGQSHVQWPTRPQHNGPLDRGPQSYSLVACRPITVVKQRDLLF